MAEKLLLQHMDHQRVAMVQEQELAEDMPAVVLSQHLMAELSKPMDLIMGQESVADALMLVECLVQRLLTL